MVNVVFDFVWRFCFITLFDISLFLSRFDVDVNFFKGIIQKVKEQAESVQTKIQAKAESVLKGGDSSKGELFFKIKYTYLTI